MKSAVFILVAAYLAACGDDPCDPDAPNTICTIIGSTTDQGYSGDRGPATDAVLYIPMDIVVSPEHDLWLLDFNNYVIRRVDRVGMIDTIIGNGDVGDSPTQENVTELPALEAYFNHTTDLFISDGYLYLAAWHNSRIKRVRTSDMMIQNFAGAGRRTFYDGDNGPALDAALDLPSSIARDPAGNIAIMDQANQVIRLVDQNTNTISTIVGTCVVEGNSPCAPGVEPVSCPNSNKLVCGDPATECMFECTPSYGGDGGPGRLARMAQPFGQQADPAGRIVYDHDGNLIFADTDNSRIRKVDTSGIITTIAGTGDAGYSGDGGPATAAKINRPVDVEIGADNSVYFTDTYNSCIRKIDPGGAITTVVGQCSPAPADRGFAGDGGPPLEAKLNRPYGIELDGNKLYVCDSYNNRVRVVNLP
jgi:adhesin/invasin